MIVTVTRRIPFPIVGIFLFVVARWILSVSVTSQPPFLVSLGLFVLCALIGHKIYPVFLTWKQKRKATMSEQLDNIHKLHAEIKGSKRL